MMRLGADSFATAEQAYQLAQSWGPRTASAGQVVVVLDPQDNLVGAWTKGEQEPDLAWFHKEWLEEIGAPVTQQQILSLPILLEPGVAA